MFCFPCRRHPAWRAASVGWWNTRVGQLFGIIIFWIFSRIIFKHFRNRYFSKTFGQFRNSLNIVLSKPPSEKSTTVPSEIFLWNRLFLNKDFLEKCFWGFLQIPNLLFSEIFLEFSPWNVLEIPLGVYPGVLGEKSLWYFLWKQLFFNSSFDSSCRYSIGNSPMRFGYSIYFSELSSQTVEFWENS